MSCVPAFLHQSNQVGSCLLEQPQHHAFQSNSYEQKAKIDPYKACKITWHQHLSSSIWPNVHVLYLFDHENHLSKVVGAWDVHSKLGQLHRLVAEVNRSLSKRGGCWHFRLENTQSQSCQKDMLQTSPDIFDDLWWHEDIWRWLHFLEDQNQKTWNKSKRGPQRTRREPSSTVSRRPWVIETQHMYDCLWMNMVRICSNHFYIINQIILHATQGFFTDLQFRIV